MTWQFTALQDKITSIQAQLLTKMEHKSDCSDQLMPMDVTNNCIQPDNSDVKTLKRKAEEYFLVDNPKSAHSFLMLDMYTQTDKTVEITLSQIYDMVRRNSEQLHKMEEMMMKICNTEDTIEENTILHRTHAPASHNAAAAKKPVSTSLIQGQPPINTRSPYIVSTQGSYNYPGMSVSNSSFTSEDYVTGVNEIADWNRADVRHELEPTVSTVPAVSMAPENRLLDANVASGTLGGPLVASEPPAEPGCWLGDVNDVSQRIWFNGDPKIIETCESYGVNPVNVALSLAEVLFTRVEMAATDMRGTRGKATLYSSKIKAIRAHIDFKYPIDEDRMEVRWRLIKPKLDSKCRSQRRLERERKWKFEQPSSTSTAKTKRPTLKLKQREMLLYGSPKTVLSPVYTGNTEESAGFSEGKEGYLANTDK